MKRKKMDEPNEEMEREHGGRGSFKKTGGRHMKRKMRRKSKRY